MAVPQNKSDLLLAIQANFTKLLKELETLPEDQLTDRGIEGHVKGTLISVKDLLAYLLGWGKLVLKWNEGKEKSLSVDFPETGYKWNELGKLACKFYEDYESSTYANVHENLIATVAAILSLIERTPDQLLYQDGWYGKWSLGRMIQFNTSSPYQNARNRIRKFKREVLRREKELS